MNSTLGRVLAGMLPSCTVRHEDTGVILEGAGLHPDILITASDRAPLVIEAEYDPADSVERDASERLGLTVTEGNRRIESAIALRYPEAVKFADDLDADIRNARFSYAVLHENGERFPTSGWLEGACEDLADMARLLSVPQSAVNQASDHLEVGIEIAASRLNEISDLRPKVATEIAGLLGMANVHQTRRMACAILANAMIFHDRVADMHEGINHLNIVCGPEVADPQAAVLDSWQRILQINYWPIFAIARDILSRMSPQDAARIIRVLRETAGKVSASGANIAHDLTGRIFQRLIADRKYLATFYTLPSSAALLARLAVAKMRDVDWSDADAIGELRVGDFACGTGALLAAVYEQLATRHENAGGKSEDLHQNMMEEVLYGCDVMPSAIHITSATLSGVYPNVRFEGSRLYTLPYGRQRDGSVAIGSLELLQSSSVMTLINTTDPARRTGSAGEETASSIVVDVHDESFDVVIMNPPFTRATNHEGAHADITNPAFAAFNATRDDQTEMGKRLNRAGRNSAYHGNAGIASAFAALAHQKIKPGGVLALVLPLSATTGESWQNFRQTLAQNYTDIGILSIAGNVRDMSFSSDTGMAECLVVARKLETGETSTDRAVFTSFNSRPAGFAQSATVAHAIDDNTGSLRAVEDGPYGGTRLTVGDELVGEMLTMSHGANGDAWAAVRLSDASLSQTAHALSESRLWLPGIAHAMELNTAPLGEVGKMGYVHRDITGNAPRGPFNKVTASPTATYPSLWNHDAKKETRIICEPDSQLIVRQGMEDKADLIWDTASRSHLNLDFRLNSQPLTVAFTERTTIGGTAWPNVIFDDERYDYTFAVWGNSTLGLLSFWWHSSRQQTGRARISIRLAESLPILDLRALSDEQHKTAENIFDEFRNLELKPAYIADADDNRASLDKRVICDLLGFDSDIYEAVRRLAQKWCAEPSVNGGKARPKDAKPVI